MNIVPIQSLSDPRLAPYANMRDAELAQRADPLNAGAHGGLFIAEGELVLRRLIASKFPVQSVLTTPTRLDSLRDALATLPAETPVFLADPPLMASIVGFNMHRGVLGIGVRLEDTPLAELASRAGPLIVLEDLTNHDNLGSIFRNAGALGGTGAAVALSPRCADPLYRKSIRVSMGAALCVPFTRLGTWPEPLHALRSAGFQTWALTPRPNAMPIGAALRALAPAARVALILGSEGPGLTDEALAACSHLVRIPMAKADPSLDSLNVAMACGVALAYLGGS